MTPRARGAPPEADAASRSASTGPGDLAELTVESIGAGGLGVAREPGGRVVFVPRTAPGDRVLAEIHDVRRSYARARSRRLLVRGRGRRPAPCPLYEGCGGCQLQHLDIGHQREAKRTIVQDALRRIGRIEIPVPPVAAAGPALAYRNRITFFLRRTTSGVVAGTRALETPAAVVDAPECLLAEDPIRAAWKDLRACWGPNARALPAGEELKLTLRTSHAGEVGLLVQGGEAGQPGAPDVLSSGVAGMTSYLWRDSTGRRHLLAGEPFLRERWQGIDFELPPEVFVQVNRWASAAIDAHIDRLVGPASGRRLLDLYAGVGARALRWAMAGGAATACDIDGQACRCARETAERCGARLRVVRGRAEQRIARLLPADVVVVNPPRCGLAPEVTRALSQAEGGQLAYVSCDPATLARDVTRLGKTWRVVSVQPFDVFPQTSHVECVAWLERRGGAG